MGISLGLVGLGSFGRAFADLFMSHPLVDRIALCDLEPERMAAFAKKPSWQSAIRSESPRSRRRRPMLAISTPWRRAIPSGIFPGNLPIHPTCGLTCGAEMTRSPTPTVFIPASGSSCIGAMMSPGPTNRLRAHSRRPHLYLQRQISASSTSHASTGSDSFGTRRSSPVVGSLRSSAFIK